MRPATIGTAMLVSVAAAGLGYATYDEVRSTDADIEQELLTVSVARRLMDADILDGGTDLAVYQTAIERAAVGLSRLRKAHPVGTMLRSRELRAIEEATAAMQQNFALYNQAAPPD